jgi:hypothetical protein
MVKTDVEIVWGRLSALGIERMWFEMGEDLDDDDGMFWLNAKACYSHSTFSILIVSE